MDFGLSRVAWQTSGPVAVLDTQLGAQTHSCCRFAFKEPAKPGPRGRVTSS